MTKEHGVEGVKRASRGRQESVERVLRECVDRVLDLLPAALPVLSHVEPLAAERLRTSLTVKREPGLPWSLPRFSGWDLVTVFDSAVTVTGHRAAGRGPGLS